MVMNQVMERLAAMALLATVPWPVFRLIVTRQFWLAFPGAAKISLRILSAYFIGVALLTLLAPMWLVFLSGAFAAIALVGLFYYGRANFGRSRGLPPGSLRPFMPGALIDKNYLLEQYRQFGSPFKSVQLYRPMFCLVGLTESMAFLQMHETSLGTPPLAFGRFIPGGFLRYMAPEKHAATKAVLRRALTRDVFEPLEPFMRDQVRQGLETMIRAASNSGTAGVAPRKHVQAMVFTVWARLFYNIAPGSKSLTKLRSLYKIIDARNPSRASDAAVKAALTDIKVLLSEQLAESRANGGNASGSFLEAIDAHCPGSVDDPTVLGNLIYLMHTSWGDISGLFVWLTRMLIDHPGWLAELRNPAPDTGSVAGEKPGLSTRIVMETLRLEQSEYLYRVTRRDINFMNYKIPRGWIVRICVHESHRDPLVFENPDAFNPDRFLNQTYNRNQYSPFGAGMRHACLGEQLSLLMGRIFVEELARFGQLETVSDGPYEFSMWRHWRPNSRWRVLMKQAA